MNSEIHSWRTAVMQYIRREAQPVDKYGHQPRLYALARQIGAGLSYDDDVVFAAAWMHDLGVFIGHRPDDPAELKTWDNVIYAIERTPELLLQFGFPPGKVPEVIEAIRTHQPHRDPQSIEATVLRNADILEQLGAMGILRAVSKVGRDTRYPTFSAVLPVLETALSTLPALLRLPSAKELAESRIEVLERFLASVKVEANGQLN
ncbi:putative HD superfamily hydrolase [Acidisarcina polymorpha]|uniref:Putative HD superfamily hydrolase n=1 Tax=Acidisarcina polymorpha TaxID=2211140 RepID=A0A2Z5FYB3_9BACT|nr:HD domain-containing protein [Acidisarcina polymorpha]AXC11457.1 putative HD superfamily hydrolase [Acidisarcina polymorpha]